MVLEALKEDLRKRDEDIDKLYTHLLSLGDEQLCNIVKANILVMLYNKVEFFFREFIFSIYDDIHDQEVSFFDLKPYIQNIISGYLFPKNSNAEQKHQTLKNLFEDKFKIYKPEKTDIANGNVDGRMFKDILKEYQISDIQFHFQAEIDLRTLKDIRNQLAHGEKDFSEIGLAYSVEQLMVCKKEIERIFLDIQDKLEISLNDRFYLNDRFLNDAVNLTQ